MSKAFMLDTQEAAEAKYKKWDKDPAPSGGEVFNQKTLYKAYKKRANAIGADLNEYNKMKEPDPEFYREASSHQYGKLNIETWIPIYEAEPLLLFFILFTLLGAIGALGDRGSLSMTLKPGLTPGKSVRSALGLTEGGPLFGFTKANELFVARLAHLWFAFLLIGEIIMGKGALAQLNIETGVPINEIEHWCYSTSPSSCLPL